MKEKNYVFDLFIEVMGSNPNGDPDTGRPRTKIINNMEYGKITDKCIKRGILEYIKEVNDLPIFIDKGMPISNKKEMIEKEYIAANNIKKNDINAEELTKFYCKKYIDVRLFGRIEPTIPVTGVVQVNDFESISPVNVIDEKLIRICHDKDENQSVFGQRWQIQYGLYRGQIEWRYLPRKHQYNNITDTDFDIFKDALLNFNRIVRTSSKNYNLVLIVQHTFNSFTDWHNIAQITNQVNVTLKDKEQLYAYSLNDYQFDINLADNAKILYKVDWI